MAKDKVYHFRIGRIGAQHRMKVNGEWKAYGKGDVIPLESATAASEPKYNNLGLIGPLIGAKDTGHTASDFKSASSIDDDAAAEAARLAALDAEKNTDGDTEDPDDAAAKLNALIEQLIQGLENASGSSEFNAARKAVIDADLFEADTLPTKKAEVIQALISLRDGTTEEDEE